MTRNFTVMQKIPLQIRVGRREKFEGDSSPLVQEVHHAALSKSKGQQSINLQLFWIILLIDTDARCIPR